MVQCESIYSLKRGDGQAFPVKDRYRLYILYTFIGVHTVWCSGVPDHHLVI